MTLKYVELTHIRDTKVDGEFPWVWIKQDTGAWDGPAEEFPEYKRRHLLHCKRFDLAVQAGGALGMYPRLYSKYFHHVYTFEPDSLNFYCLVNNCQSPTIHKFNVALGREARMIEMNESERTNSGMHTVNLNIPNATIPMITIDSLKLPTCDLIQLDIEGFEADALFGAQETIRKFHPIIQTELARGEVPYFMEQEKYKKIDEYCADIFWQYQG
jgi:FkbM family methyltransferase